AHVYDAFCRICSQSTFSRSCFTGKESSFVTPHRRIFQKLLGLIAAQPVSPAGSQLLSQDHLAPLLPVRSASVTYCLPCVPPATVIIEAEGLDSPDREDY